MKVLQQLIGRAQAVIQHVIFDVGGSSLAGGTFVLDKAFRLRFLSVTARQRHRMIASVRLGDIAESAPFRALPLSED